MNCYNYQEGVHKKNILYYSFFIPRIASGGDKYFLKKNSNKKNRSKHF